MKDPQRLIRKTDGIFNRFRRRNYTSMILFTADWHIKLGQKMFFGQI